GVAVRLEDERGDAVDLTIRSDERAAGVAVANLRVAAAEAEKSLIAIEQDRVIVLVAERRLESRIAHLLRREIEEIRRRAHIAREVAKRRVVHVAVNAAEREAAGFARTDATTQPLSAVAQRGEA